MMDIFYLERGTLKIGKVKDLPKLKNKKIWIDITDITQHEADLLGKFFDLHNVTEDDLISSHGRIKVEQFPHYLFCTFYSVGKDSKKKIKLVPLDYVIGNKFLISAHRGELETYEKIKEDKDRLKRIMAKGVDALFHRLLDEEIDNFFPVLERLDDEIEEIDENLAIKASSELLSEILEIKKKIVEIKKITFPQREKISFLARKRYKFISEESQPYFRDIYDHSIRVSDIIENYRESISSTFDAYMTSVANSTNEVMKVLSIVATIALPLSVIAGIWGTNFFNLPGIKDADGFWIMIILMNIVVIVMLIFFKKRKWI